jgi:hypothetical protein
MPYARRSVVQLEETIAKELAAIINERLAQYFKAIDARLTAVESRELVCPEKGERGERGEKGDRGDVGLRGETGIPGRDGKDGRDGEIGPPGPQGEPGTPGLNGKDGADGMDGAGPSRGRHRGPWKADEQYHLDDSVTSGGSGWIAMVENAKGRPGDSKDWQLFVKKGRDGKDGERGPQGPVGAAGKDNAYA